MELRIGVVDGSRRDQRRLVVSVNPIRTTKIYRLSGATMSSTVFSRSTETSVIRRHHERTQNFWPTLSLSRTGQQYTSRRAPACAQPAVDGHVRCRPSVRHAGGVADVGLRRWPPPLTRRLAFFRSALEAT